MDPLLESDALPLRQRPLLRDVESRSARAPIEALLSGYANIFNKLPRGGADSQSSIRVAGFLAGFARNP
jgi:hypothetical protein